LFAEKLNGGHGIKGAESVVPEKPDRRALR
jgi:hypothetical protein